MTSGGDSKPNTESMELMDISQVTASSSNNTQVLFYPKEQPSGAAQLEQLAVKLKAVDMTVLDCLSDTAV